MAVAEAFCDRRAGDNYIISRDGDINNLHSSNLYWSPTTAYRLENPVKVRIKKGPRRGEDQPMSKLSDSQARQIKYDRDTKGCDLAMKFQVSSTIISRIRTGKVWTHI